MSHVVKFQSLNPASKTIFATFTKDQTNKIKTDIETIFDIYNTSAQLLIVGSKGFDVHVGASTFDFFFKPNADAIPGKPGCFDLNVYEIKRKN